MGTPPVQPAADLPPPARRRRLRWPETAGKRVVAVITFATALVGLATGVVALVDEFRDDPAPERWVRLGDVTAEPMSFGDSLARRDLELAGYTRARLACPVAFVNGRVTANGYKGARLAVRWQLFRASGGFVRASRMDFEVRPTADVREVEFPLAVPLPREPGSRYHVIVRVIDENGQVTLADRQTLAFAARPSRGAADCDVG
jgi:hypothetical protein